MKWRLRLCVSIEVRPESWSPIMPFTVRGKKKRLPLLGGLEQGAHVHPTLVGTNKETKRKRNQKVLSPDLMANGYFSKCH